MRQIKNLESRKWRQALAPVYSMKSTCHLYITVLTCHNQHILVIVNVPRTIANIGKIAFSCQYTFKHRMVVTGPD